MYTIYQISGNQTIAASTSAVSFFIYEKATLFPSTLLVNESRGKDKEVKRIVGSYVISGTVEGFEVNNLSDDSPVEILFALKEVSMSISASCGIQTHRIGHTWLVCPIFKWTMGIAELSI